MQPTITQINKLPQMATSYTREAQWAVEYWQRIHSESKTQCETAWKLYQDAVDNAEPREQINALFDMAVMFDNIRSEAWRHWDNAKAQLLALLN